MKTCDCNPDAAVSPALKALREQFREYTRGWLSEKDFKLAVSRYSETLRAARKQDSQSAMEATQ